MEKSAVPTSLAPTTPVFFTALGFLALALAPMWLRSHGHGLASLAIGAFFSKLCHQHPDRSLVLFGAPSAVCVRCLGIYAGAAIGSLIRLEQRTAIRCLAAALALNGLDVASEILALHGNMPPLRFLLGLLMGITAGALLSSGSQLSGISSSPTLE